MPSVTLHGKEFKVRKGELDLSHSYLRDIADIKGLNALTDLQHLDLHGNELTEIRGLDALENLQHLDLSENPIGKIEGLDNLRKLQVLVCIEMYSSRMIKTVCVSVTSMS